MTEPLSQALVLFRQSKGVDFPTLDYRVVQQRFPRIQRTTLTIPVNRVPMSCLGQLSRSYSCAVVLCSRADAEANIDRILYQQMQRPVIVLDDDGTIHRTVNADGTVTESINMTLEELIGEYLESGQALSQ